MPTLSELLIGLKEAFECPITMEPMQDPVVAIYSGRSIETRGLELYKSDPFAAKSFNGVNGFILNLQLQQARMALSGLIDYSDDSIKENADLSTWIQNNILTNKALNGAFVCSLTNGPMKNPAVLVSANHPSIREAIKRGQLQFGVSYEREALQKCLRELTGSASIDDFLVTNITLKNIIDIVGEIQAQVVAIASKTSDADVVTAANAQPGVDKDSTGGGPAVQLSCVTTGGLFGLKEPKGAGAATALTNTGRLTAEEQQLIHTFETYIEQKNHELLGADGAAASVYGPKIALQIQAACLCIEVIKDQSVTFFNLKQLGVLLEPSATRNPSNQLRFLAINAFGIEAIHGLDAMLEGMAELNQTAILQKTECGYHPIRTPGQAKAPAPEGMAHGMRY